MTRPSCIRHLHRDKHSRVTFDIEPKGDRLVRLTVMHEDLERDPRMLAGVSGGWPTILSNLKTWLETGRALQHASSEPSKAPA